MHVDGISWCGHQRCRTSVGARRGSARVNASGTDSASDSTGEIGVDAQRPEGVGRPPEQPGPLEPLHRSPVGQCGCCPRVVGHGREHLDRQGASDVGRRELGSSRGDDEEAAPSQLGGQAGQRLPQMDDGLERGWTEDHQRISPGQHLPHAASEVGEQATHIDHHIGVEGTERIGDDRPGLLVGDGLVHAAQTKEHRETPGEVVDVVPDVLGWRVRRAAAKSEERPPVGAMA